MGLGCLRATCASSCQAAYSSHAHLFPTNFLPSWAIGEAALLQLMSWAGHYPHTPSPGNWDSILSTFWDSLWILKQIYSPIWMFEKLVVSYNCIPRFSLNLNSVISPPLPTWTSKEWILLKFDIESTFNFKLSLMWSPLLNCQISLWVEVFSPLDRWENWCLMFNVPQHVYGRKAGT